MEVVEPGGDLLIVTANGYGKRTSLKKYPVKKRASRGILTINKKAISKVGEIVAARVVQDDDHLSIMSSGGVIIRTKVKDISRTGRVTKGVLLMNLLEGDSVASIARIAHADLKSVGAAS